MRSVFNVGSKWLIILIALMSIAWRATPPSQAQSNPPLTPITAANAAQIKPLFSHVIGPGRGILFSPDSSLMAIPEIVGPAYYSRLYNLHNTYSLSPFSGTSRIDAFSGDSKQVIGDDYVNTYVWDIATNQLVLTIPGRFDAIDPTDRYLLTGQLTLWRLADGTKLTTLTSVYHNIGFSPDGAYLGWSDVEKTIHIWSLSTNSEVSTMQLGDRDSTAQFSPDSKQLALVAGNTLLIWDMAGKAWSKKVPIDPYHTTITFSSNSKLLFEYNGPYAGVGADVLIFYVQSGLQVGALTHLNGDTPLDAATLSPDGHTWLFYSNQYVYPYTADYGTTLQAWDAATQTEAPLPNDVKQGVGKVWFSPDRTLTFLERVKTFPFTTEIRDAATWKLITTLPGINYSPSPDGASLVRLTSDEYFDVLMVFGVPDATRPGGKLILPGHAAAAIYLRATPSSLASVSRLAKGDQGLAIGQNNGYVYLADRGGWARIDPLYFALDDGFPISDLPALTTTNAIPFTPTPTIVFVPSATPTPTSTPIPNAPTATLSPLVFPTPATLTPLQSGESRITRDNVDQVRLLGVIPGNAIPNLFSIARYPGALLSNNGQTLVQLLPSLHIWNMQTLTELPQLATSSSGLLAAALGNNGQLFAYVLASDTKTVHVWDIPARVERATVPVPTIPNDPYYPSYYMVFSPDDRQIAVSTYSGVIQVWDTQTDQAKATIQYKLSYPGNITFSPDGTILASNSDYTNIHLWDSATGQQTGTLEMAADAIRFSPDGSTIAAMNISTVSLWDVHTGTLKAVLDSHSNDNYDPQVAFSPDSRSMLTYRASLSQTYYDYFHLDIPIVLWDVASGTQKAKISGTTGLFATNQTWWAVEPSSNEVQLYNLSGEALAAVPFNCASVLVLSPNQQLLGCGSRFLDLPALLAHTIPGNYVGGQGEMFSADGSRWIVPVYNALMVFGIPSAAHLAWQPVAAQVTVNGLSIHESPNVDSRVIGTVKGNITVGGRVSSGAWVYVPDAHGWINPAYVDLKGYPIERLPVLNGTPNG